MGWYRCSALIAVTMAWSIAGATQASFSFDAAPGRLPKDIVPVSYAIDLVPDLESMTTTGAETVKLRFRVPSGRLIFNSINQQLSDVRLDGAPVANVASDDAQQLTTVTLPVIAPAGAHVLTFNYRGRIEAQPRGLFAQHYAAPGGGVGVLLSTKMEGTDARRMFPCWDEPSYRAIFELTVTVPAQWAAVSNMPIARRRVHGALATIRFKPTPRMPSYLIEFTGGDLEQKSVRSAGVDLGVWAVRGHAQDGLLALLSAQRILADYNDYFGIRYPLPKLDSIAVPGGFAGAMENWGAITYNDRLLLLTGASTAADEQTVFGVQAHEMAHQWNGDLVTMGWWDDLWLNESFASWRGISETALRNPSWKAWEAQDAAKEVAMHADARASSHPIQQPVADELQAAAVFDPEITYNKGQSVLRMFEAFLGPDVFRDGVRRYLSAHAYSNATTADLWAALSAASGTNMTQIAADWTEQPGFPLVTVTAHCDPGGGRTLSLSQARFLLNGVDSKPSHWSIPLQIRTGARGTSMPVLMMGSEQSLPAGRCDEALTLNAGAIGFYRVRYDAATLATDTARFAELPDTDKIAMLDDQWALVETRMEPLGSYLALAASMGGSLDGRAWQQIAAALGIIEYDERGRPGHDAYAAFARHIIRPVIEQLGWDERAHETAEVRQLRRTLVAALGLWGDPDTIAEARRRFAAFVLDHRSLRPDDQEIVLSIVARNADATEFEQLHQIARAAIDETEQRRYYGALMDVGDPQLAERAAQIALSDELPPQAALWRLALVQRLINSHPQLAWTTFRTNADTLLAPHPKYAPLIIAQQVPDRFWDCAPADEIESWVRAHAPTELSANVDRGMESARFKLGERPILDSAADAYLGMPLPIVHAPATP